MRKAVPTEYKGILYKSKSEAMFARWIELVHGVGASSGVGCYFEASGIIYEPTFLSVDGWVPDFVWWSFEASSEIELNVTRYLFEYKPSRPTDAYINKFIERTKILEDLGKVCVSSLYFGSVFTLDRGYLFGGYSGCKPLDYDWIKHHEQDIRNYRYDLVDTNA